MVNNLNFANTTGSNSLFGAFQANNSLFNPANAFNSSAFPGTPDQGLLTSNITRDGFQQSVADRGVDGATSNLAGGIPSAVRFGQDLASGMDGRELVRSALVNGATAAAAMVPGGGPLLSAAVNMVAEPIAYDISTLGMDSQATQDAISNRIAGFMTAGATDINRGLGKYGIKELDEIGKTISSGLGKTGLFGSQNKGTQARHGAMNAFNNIIKDNNLELDLFDDFAGDFKVEDDGQGGKTTKIGRKINELKAEFGDEEIFDLQRIGGVFAMASGLDKDAGRGQIANTIALNVKGDKEKFKTFMDASGATPESLFANTIAGFGDGKMSVVEAVESARSIDRIYGTGFAGSDVILRIANMVEEGGPDRLVDGSEFGAVEPGQEFRREDFLDNEGNPRDLSNTNLINNLSNITGTGEGAVARSEDLSKVVERSNLVDSFSRVSENRSLTPDNPVNDIIFSMRILEKKLKDAGENPDNDPDIKRAKELIKEQGGRL